MLHKLWGSVLDNQLSFLPNLTHSDFSFTSGGSGISCPQRLTRVLVQFQFSSLPVVLQLAPGWSPCVRYPTIANDPKCRRKTCFQVLRQYHYPLLHSLHWLPVTAIFKHCRCTTLMLKALITPQLAPHCLWDSSPAHLDPPLLKVHGRHASRPSSCSSTKVVEWSRQSLLFFKHYINST